MTVFLLSGLLLAAADSPDAGEQALEERVRELEQELAKLRLSAQEAPLEQALLPLASVQPNVFNPTLTVFGNGLYRFDDRPVEEEGLRLDNQFNLREIELDARAAVDPFADGLLILAVESESPGQFEAGVEEGYVTIKRLPLPLLDEPPLGLKLKLGRFRTEVGRVNRIHLHDLPHTSVPLALQEFYGEEGHIAGGLSAQLFLPTPFDEDSAVELTAQALTGGGVFTQPGLVANLRWFRALGSAHNLDLSLVWHRGRAELDSGPHVTTWAADFLYKWKPLRGGEFSSFLLGGEVFYSPRKVLAPILDQAGEPAGVEERQIAPWGYFAFGQYQLSRSSYAGLRWDDTRSIEDGTTRRRAVSAYLSWYASEFLRLRFGYERRISDLPAEDGRNSAFAEINFVFGAHPPEPFWVNR